MYDFRMQYSNMLINPLKGLWKTNKVLAYKLVVTFIKLIPQFDGINVIAFMENHKEELTELLTSDVYSIDTIDVHCLDYNSSVYLSTILDNQDGINLKFAIKIGNLFWKRLFSNDYMERIDKIFELESDYIHWLADYMLNISDNDRSILIQELMPFVQFDRVFNNLLSNIVSAEDINPRYHAFWNLWLLMLDYIIPIYEKNINDYRIINKEVHIGYGFEDVLLNYLLANPFWKEGVNEWHSLKPQNRTFYFSAVQRLGYNPTTLYSIARVLYTVGKKVFMDDGVIWLSEIISTNPHLHQKPLPENTLFYIEEYIFSYVKTHSIDFHTNIDCKRKAIIILDFLVERGSTVGFLLREEII